MRTTFVNLRFGVLVGIGGGVPMKTDNGMIRLGDVVVSKPTGGHSGAVQYDHGKAKVGQFERTGALAPPPAVLLNAAQDLAVKRARSHKDPLEENIKKIDTSIRGLRKYKHPGAAHDYLYPPDYIHEKPGVSCAECGCDPLQRIQRTTDDGDDEPYIVVHRGTTASGEVGVKDAMLRDTLAKEYGVLCFEREAAGTLADFPCIVIRGISDYCDSHKNDQWHGYAAVAAAAYARQLFFHMLIDEVKRYISETAEKDIQHVKLRQDDQDCQKVLDWLTPVDYGPQQSDYLKRRQPGTGQWLLDSAEYHVWLKTNKQTLFCPGIPGAGKTILTAIVVNDLAARASSDPTIGVAYIYCNFRQQGTQNIDGLMASLLKQLAQSQSSLLWSVKDLYEQHKTKKTQPSLDEIFRVLRSIATMYSRAFIIVDALDECQVSDGSRARFLSELFSLQTRHGANIFATSRFIPEILDWFKSSISLEIRATTDDVARYIEGNIWRLPSFVQNNQQLQKEIHTGISEAVDGMFLLAQIYLGLLEDKLTLNDIRSALEVFQKQGRESGEDQKVQVLAYAYEQTMDRIKGQKPGLKELAINVLSWITCAKRPLIALELQHALVTKAGKSKLDEGDLPDTGDMIAVCSGLVTIDEDSGIIRLVHYTTQEYFQRTQKHWFPNAELHIMSTCVVYLSFSVFENGFCETDESFEERLRTNQLYDYAAHYWGYHARKVSVPCQSVIEFLEDTAKVEASSQALMAVKRWSLNSGYSQLVQRQMTGLHLAAYFGAQEAVKTLLGEQRPDLKDSYGRTPLSYAAENGHKAVVKLLVEKGAELETKDKYWGKTPLSWAAKNGHEAVVKLLLDEGAELETKDYGGRTPLSWAARNGHKAVVKLLLEKGAEKPQS